MQIALKGNNASVTIKEILLKSPKYYLPESNEETGGEINQVILEKDLPAANEVLARWADNLHAHLDAGNNNRTGSFCLSWADVKNM